MTKNERHTVYSRASWSNAIFEAVFGQPEGPIMCSIPLDVLIDIRFCRLDAKKKLNREMMLILSEIEIAICADVFQSVFRHRSRMRIAIPRPKCRLHNHSQTLRRMNKCSQCVV